jgi:hypothetical protein
LRTNAVGTNLNREWAEPTPEKSPEVLAILIAHQREHALFADFAQFGLGGGLVLFMCRAAGGWATSRGAGSRRRGGNTARA